MDNEKSTLCDDIIDTLFASSTKALSTHVRICFTYRVALRSCALFHQFFVIAARVAMKIAAIPISANGLTMLPAPHVGISSS